MSNYLDKEFQIFRLFRDQWALVTAGTMDHFNSCTIGWGSLGTLWTRPGHDGSAVTVYVHPGRYTCDFLLDSDTFTVSFFPQECRQALSYMGSHSGRDGDKAAEAGLTPVAIGDSVTYKEATLTFLCRKIYQGQFDKESITPDMQERYRDYPNVYPAAEDGSWQPHWVFVGEILEVKEEEA